MSPLDTIVLVSSWSLTLPYVCRLDALRLGKHRTPIVLLHVLLFAGCMAAGVHAWSGITDLTDVCIVSVAALWIVVSYPTWQAGVPEYQRRPPSMGALPDAVLQRLVGGRSGSDRSEQ